MAKAKNVCQVCLLDLEYGIPVQARDTALGIEDESLPESDVGKEFKLKEMENAGLLESSYSKVCGMLLLKDTLHSLLQHCAISTDWHAQSNLSSNSAHYWPQIGALVSLAQMLKKMCMSAGKAERFPPEDAAHDALLQEECPANLLLLRQGRVQARRRVPLPP